MCMIEDKHNPADTTKVHNTNPLLFHIIRNNSEAMPVKRVLVLQHSLYRYVSFITNSSVPMNDNFIQDSQPQPVTPTSSHVYSTTYSTWNSKLFVYLTPQHKRSDSVFNWIGHSDYALYQTTFQRHTPYDPRAPAGPIGHRSTGAANLTMYTDSYDNPSNPFSSDSAVVH